MARSSYQSGDVVDIVAGTYKKYKTGTYLGRAGLTMAAVLVHGIQEQHNLRWTSIKKKVDDPPHVDTKTALVIALNDIEDITKSLKAMELNLRNILSKLD